MNKTLTSLAAIAALSFPALAMAQDADTDGNGTLSMEEAQAAYPEVTEDTFATIDTNGDGELDEAEVQAARDAGTLPPADG